LKNGIGLNSLLGVFMAVGKLNSSSFYFAHLQSAPIARTSTNARLAGSQGPVSSPQTLAQRVQGWIVPILTLIGTAGAMWFVVTDGWFRLFGFWSL
jgi:hypothetical protein